MAILTMVTTNRVAIKLRRRNTNATTIPTWNSSTKALGYTPAVCITRAVPNPTSMLNIGPAKQPAMAIVGWPFLANATSATRSPTEFPHAKTVMPSIAGGRSIITPIAARQFRSSPAMVEIQKTLITNDMRVLAMFSVSGDSFSKRKWDRAKQKLTRSTTDQRGKRI
ncbi:hypothetical protein ACQJBY_048791 [Aegilops geniculata]|uniref:Uncharacterized protein n=1 Tax=Aegilops tauschii TaxID=37682 RepID=M8AUH5_AEGTA